MGCEKCVAHIDHVVRRRLVDPASGEEREYFFGTMSAAAARELTFVPVLDESSRTYLEERTESGYQRVASTTRMNLFTRFLREHPLSVIPPVVLSGRGGWRFEGSEIGVLHLTDAAAIIDGQHRVGGYVHLWEQDDDNRPIDFVLIPNLEVDDEADEFLTINNTQKGVTKALTAYIESTDEAVVAWELNRRDDSPFVGRISRQKLTHDQLFALNSAAKNVARTFSHGAFALISIDEKVDLMIRYWTLIADAHPDAWADLENADRSRFVYKLLELTGLIAWSHAASDILGPAFDPDTSTMDWVAVEQSIRRLAARIDWRKNGEFEGRTGEAGGKVIHRLMQHELQSGTLGG